MKRMGEFKCFQTIPVFEKTRFTMLLWFSNLSFLVSSVLNFLQCDLLFEKQKSWQFQKSAELLIIKSESPRLGVKRGGQVVRQCKVRALDCHNSLVTFNEISKGEVVRCAGCRYCTTQTDNIKTVTACKFKQYTCWQLGICWTCISYSLASSLFYIISPNPNGLHQECGIDSKDAMIA